MIKPLTLETKTTFFYEFSHSAAYSCTKHFLHLDFKWNILLTYYFYLDEFRLTSQFKKKRKSSSLKVKCERSENASSVLKALIFLKKFKRFAVFFFCTPNPLHCSRISSSFWNSYCVVSLFSKFGITAPTKLLFLKRFFEKKTLLES